MEPLQAADPRQVGGYRLLGRLGAGGMGQVFLGASPGGRQVAVKVIHHGLALDEGFRGRFRREVAAARRVSGAFTAPVIDADPDAPEPWLVTSYVPGPSLEQEVSQRGPLSAPSVLGLGAGLAEALAAIHDAGVVHRDLKPSNVLLAPDGPRVIDFGIARAAEVTAITGTGFVIGSPGFMSPEQVISGEAGPASDIFSLGAVLCFAATGCGPFGEGPAHTLLYRAAHAEPALDAIGDGRLRALLAACLAKDPAQRPRPRQILGLAGGRQAGLAGGGQAGLDRAAQPGSPRAVPPVQAPSQTTSHRPAAAATATAVAAQPPADGPRPPADAARPRADGLRAGRRSLGGRPGRLAAVIGAGGLAVAAGVVAVFVLRGSGGDPAAHPTGSPTPGLASVSGRPRANVFDDTVEQVGSLAVSFRHIRSRAVDPAPLTRAEVFGQAPPGAQPVFGTVALRRVGGALAPDCKAEVWGTRLRQQLHAAGCTQVVRETYLPRPGKRLGGRYLAMVVVFNLSDNAAARRVAFAMGPPVASYDPVTGRVSRGGTAGFVLPPPVVPFSGLGGNKDNEAEATAMGHFLVVSWVQGPAAYPDLDRKLLSSVEDAAVRPVEYQLAQRHASA